MSHLVLLPGMACDASVWHTQRPAFEAAGQDVSVSDLLRRAPTMETMAASLPAGRRPTGWR